ncbi:hypothetical protein [Uliginosibacterium gangwonense]|uniref:hypothetical protein n=1 Tax=Uliginosibacterium gangwonense TaxID=392736 RepID=UPI000362F437|nr:hypothetical protein [Uliginosibacterium gangwonense]
MLGLLPKLPKEEDELLLAALLPLGLLVLLLEEPLPKLPNEDEVLPLELLLLERLPKPLEDDLLEEE